MKPVPFHHLFSFRVSIQYTGAIFDVGGDRILHVDVDHHSINILQREQIKKSIAIADVESLYTPKRQAMQMVVVERETKVQNTLWFMNQGELDLFHAVVQDLKDGKHPGNRIRVPLLRQATIMKRNRAGFFNIRHATLMPGKMVLARTKGNAAPDDVVPLREAALGLDEKKGLITIGVAGRTSVWKGLSPEDTFKWHDALLSALSGPAPVSKTQAQKRNGKPPRLSMIYGDELSTDRVYKARESLFMDMSGMEAGSDDFEPPELDSDDDESPLPDSAMLTKQADSADDLMPSPRSQQTDSAAPALKGLVKAAIGQMRDNVKKQKARDRALSTVTQIPDDLAWRDAENLNSSDNMSDLSEEPFEQQQQRWSADEAPGLEKGRKGHKRTGSAPPSMPIGSLRHGNQGDLQGIPEEQDMNLAGSNKSSSPQKVHFLDGKLDREASLLTTGLGATDRSITSTPLPEDSNVVHTESDVAKFESTGSVQHVLNAQLEVPKLAAPVQPIKTSAIDIKPGHSSVSQSPSSDAVTFPPTPERPRHAPPGMQAGTESCSSPIIDTSAGDAYAPVSWPDVQDVRLLQQKAGSLHLPVSQGTSHNLVVSANTSGKSPTAHKLQEYTLLNSSAQNLFTSASQHSTAVDATMQQSQRDSVVADGTFLPVAPRDVLMHPAPANNSVHQLVEASTWPSAGPSDPDYAVLHSLGKAWLHRSKLRGMVRQLKGSLLSSTQQGVSADDFVDKLDCIDQMLDEMPELTQHYQAPADSANTTMPAEVLPTLPGQVSSESAVQRSSHQQHTPNIIQMIQSGIQPTPVTHNEVASPVSVSNTEWRQAAGDARSSSAAMSEQEGVLLNRHIQQYALQSASPELDAIASQMDAQSAELLHHVSIAMAHLPSSPATDPGVQSVTGPTQHEPPLQSHSYVQNPLFVNRPAGHSRSEPMIGVPASFSDLISRIRLTEYRLQEAITSLTDATHRFKQDMPHHAAQALRNENSGQQLCLTRSNETPTMPGPSPVQPWQAGHGSTDEGRKIASPLRSLEWTQLNPLYPSSSHSISPESQMTSRPVSRALSPVHVASKHTDLLHTAPGHKDHFGSTVLGDYGQCQAAQLQCGAADQAGRCQTPSPAAHNGCSDVLVSSNMSKAGTETQRPSAIESMVSVSSAWSLEQPLRDDICASGHMLSDGCGTTVPSLQHDRMWTWYPASSASGQTSNKAYAQGHSARPILASTGNASISLYHEDDSEEGGPLRESASLPDWHSREPDATPWLEERNSHRVSYYEDTIFTLRQAGIHVEPHWFGPVTTCATDLDNETRTATDNICRAARSIAQSATDLESYVLKRFPVTPAPEYTDWVHDAPSASSSPPPDARRIGWTGDNDINKTHQLRAGVGAPETLLARSGIRPKAKSHYVAGKRQHSSQITEQGLVSVPGTSTFHDIATITGCTVLKE